MCLVRLSRPTVGESAAEESSCCIHVTWHDHCHAKEWPAFLVVPIKLGEVLDSHIVHECMVRANRLLPNATQFCFYIHRDLPQRLSIRALTIKRRHEEVSESTVKVHTGFLTSRCRAEDAHHRNLP